MAVIYIYKLNYPFLYDLLDFVLGIFTNIHKLEANNCLSIITKAIIQIPKQNRPLPIKKDFYLNELTG